MIIRKISRRGIWWRFASNVPFYCRPAGRWEWALSLKPTASIRLQGDPSDSAATAPKALRAIAVLQRRYDQRKEPRETYTTGIPAGKRKQHRQLIIWQIKRIDSTNLERVKLSKEVSFIYPAAAAQSLQSCPTQCDPMDHSPPDSSVHGILQARILEWAAIPFSRGSSWPRDRTQAFHIASRFFTSWATWEALWRPSIILILRHQSFENY